MKTTVQWLDQAKTQHGLSDYALAPKLGISRSQMSKYRGGADFLSDDAAVLLAELLEVNPIEIMASAHAERSKSEAAKAIWMQWAEKLGGVAVSVLLTAGMLAGISWTPDAHSAQRSQIPSKTAAKNLYIVSSRKRKKRQTRMGYSVFNSLA